MYFFSNINEREVNGMDLLEKQHQQQQNEKEYIFEMNFTTNMRMMILKFFSCSYFILIAITLII